MKPIRIFISSVQREFAVERAALRDYLHGDALMRRFFEPFLFEDVPAADRRADEQIGTGTGTRRSRCRAARLREPGSAMTNASVVTI